jgi:DNA-binding transcriptional LysR family regulator
MSEVLQQLFFGGTITMQTTRRNRRSSVATGTVRAVAFGSWATIRDLEVLRAVVRHGSFSAAARELGISQPAISRTIAQIERLSGRLLFERRDGECVPTSDALAVYEESTPVFEGLERIERFSWIDDVKTTFNIAAPPTQAHCFLPEVLPGFLSAHPSVKISIEIRTTLDVVSMVAEAAADIAIGEVPAGDWNVRRLPFRRSIFVVALPEGHRLAAAKQVQANDLAGERLILQVRRNPVRSQIDRLLSQTISPNVVIESSNALSAVQLVGRGQGISLVNAFPVMLHKEPGVIYRSFLPRVTQDTCFILPEARPPRGITKQFIDYIRENQPKRMKYSQALVGSVRNWKTLPGLG